jgi:spore maturation protein CgeB
MNLLIFYPEGKSFMGQWQKHHIIDELQRNKHVIHLFDPTKYSSPEQANIELIRFIRSNPIKFDLFINSLGSNEIFPETISQIKNYGIKTLLICFDNLHAPYMHKTIAQHFNLVWLTSRETKGMFEHWGCKTLVMPYAANPYVFKPKYESEIPAIGFIGIPYGTRIDKINLLLKYQIKCQVHSQSLIDKEEAVRNSAYYFELIKSGMNLLRFPIGRKIISAALIKKLLTKNETSLIDSNYLERKPSVTFDEMNCLYSNFAISLGITELRNTFVLKQPIHKLHLRTFEIPMCGGLQLSSYTEELAEYFEDEKEIILYKTNEEMISKVKFYLNPENKKVREKMKRNARERAENDHTWINRFNIAFKLLLS